MNVTAVIETLTSLGGLAGLAAFITSAAGLIETRRRLRPNHGSSISDAVSRIEAAQTQQGKDIRDLRSFVGHQIGEIRRDANREHADYDTRIRHLEEHTR